MARSFRHLLQFLMVLIISVSFGAFGQNAPDGTFEFAVRSFWTNYSVPATIMVRSAQPASQSRMFSTDEFGRLQVNLPPGDYLFSIRAAGYESSEDAHFRSEGGRILPVTIVLHPLTEPQELKTEPKLLRPGFTLVAGWVVDAVTGKPLSKVRIRINGGRTEEETNERGYYALSVPSPRSRIIAGGELPGIGTLVAELSGYKTSIETNVLLPDGSDAGINVELERGSGTAEHDHRHKLDVPTDTSPLPKPKAMLEPLRSKIITDPSSAESGQPADDLKSKDGDVPQVFLATTITLPTYIRVGSVCSTSTTCTTVTRYSLKTMFNKGWKMNGSRPGLLTH